MSLRKLSRNLKYILKITKISTFILNKSIFRSQRVTDKHERMSVPPDRATETQEVMSTAETEYFSLNRAVRL